MEPVNNNIKIVYTNVGIDMWPVSVPINTDESYDSIIYSKGKYATFYAPEITNKYNGYLQNQNKLINQNNPNKTKSKPYQIPKNSDYFNHFDNRCISEINDRNQKRNICENGCMTIFPAVTKVMDVHISNVKEIDADMYILLEMCNNRLSAFSNNVRNTEPLIRIKAKEKTFVSNPNWDPKIDAIISVNNKIESKNACFFADGVTNGALTFIDNTIDENNILDSIHIETESKSAKDIEQIENALIRALYNCNLTLMRDNDGNNILLWSVHWPPIREINNQYNKELDNVFNNIIKYLEKNKNVNFLALGDFNTKVEANRKLFNEYRRLLTNLPGTRYIKDLRKDNDGVLSCLISQQFNGITFTIHTPSTAQPLSAHNICIVELQKTINAKPNIINVSSSTYSMSKPWQNKSSIPQTNQPTQFKQSQQIQQTQQQQYRPLQARPQFQNLPPQQKSTKIIYNEKIINKDQILKLVTDLEPTIPFEDKRIAGEFLYKQLLNIPDRLNNISETITTISNLYKRVYSSAYANNITNNIYPIVLQNIYSLHTMKGGAIHRYINAKYDYIRLCNM